MSVISCFFKNKQKFSNRKKRDKRQNSILEPQTFVLFAENFRKNCICNFDLLSKRNYVKLFTIDNENVGKIVKIQRLRKTE